MEKKVLYIKSNFKSEADSYSLQVGRSFINSYKKQNPAHIVEELDLFSTEVPLLSARLFKLFGELQSGAEYTFFSDEDKKLLTNFNSLTEQFISADAYVISSPMWNFSIPPILKAYIDVVVQAGKTFKYTEKGPEGLLLNKKAIHIQASGSVFSQGPAQDLEMSHRYIKQIFAFMGVSDMDFVYAEGLALDPNKVSSIMKDATSIAETKAMKF